MVPRGTDAEPYEFTKRERARLREVVLPALLHDRARIVRVRAQAVLDELDSFDEFDALNTTEALIEPDAR